MPDSQNQQPVSPTPGLQGPAEPTVNVQTDTQPAITSHVPTPNPNSDINNMSIDPSILQQMDADSNQTTNQPIEPEPRPPDPNADKKGINSTQNALQIAEIRDGLVIMNDGTFRTVVIATSINFDLMSPEEREAVEYAYQGFLNSLYFPVQIFIRSSRIDIVPYIERLDKLRAEHDNMLLALLMEDYINFIISLSEEANIMDKRFYVAIPYYPPVTTQAVVKGGKKLFGNLFSAFKQNRPAPIITIDEAALEKAKTELRNRTQSVISGLAQVGVRAIALDTEELIELYYDTYNPDTATRQTIKNFNNLTATMIDKGEGDPLASGASVQNPGEQV